MVQLIPLLRGFQPPNGVSQIRVDRFSPYFDSYRHFGWLEIFPLRAYCEVHQAVPPELIPQMAYHFEGDGRASCDESLHKNLNTAVSEWHRKYLDGEGLFWHPDVGLFEISGGRNFGYEMTPLLDRLLRLTIEPIGIKKVMLQAGVTDDELRVLASGGVFYIEGNQIVNLAIRTGWTIEELLLSQDEDRSQSKGSMDSSTRLFPILST